MYRFPEEPNFASLAAALKAGNPNAVVAFNPGVRVPVTCHCEYEDYTAGEVTLSRVPDAIRTCLGRWVHRDGHKAQFDVLSFLGTSRCRGDRPQLTDERIIDYTRQINRRGGVVTWDVPVDKNGAIPEPFLKQWRAVGNAMARRWSKRRTSRSPGRRGHALPASLRRRPGFPPSSAALRYGGRDQQLSRPTAGSWPP